MDIIPQQSTLCIADAGHAPPGVARSRRALWAAVLVAGACLGCVEASDEHTTALNRMQAAPIATPRVQPAPWEALDAEPRGWKFIVLHHSATPQGNVASIHEAHRQRVDSAGNAWRGIGYHFVIGNGAGMADGEIDATFRWREQADGAHAGLPTFNQLGIGICLIGNFEQQQPTRAQVDSARRLVRALQEVFGIDNDRVLTHRDLKATACPGTLLTVRQILETPGRDLARAESAANDGAE